jgi:hypothetical protein
MTKPKAKLITFKRYQIVRGKKILSIITRRIEGLNREYQYCRFACHCGKRFERSFSAVVQAERYGWAIRCDDCAKAEKREQGNARGRAQGADSFRKPNGLFDLSKVNLTPDQQRRVDAIVARHYGASKRVGTPREASARICGEAIEIVLAEDTARERGSDVEDYFSGESVRRPAFQSYPQYFSRDSSIS